MSEHLHTVVHDGDGPHALVVHGAMASRSYWADNIEALSTVCPPVVVELWGHGRSPSPDDPLRYEWESYCAEFEAIRHRLGVEHWFTIGQSLGAALILNYGLMHPDRVIGQVVTNSSSAFTPLDRWQQRRAGATGGLVQSIRDEGTAAVKDHWINPGRSRRISASTRDLLALEFDEHDARGIATSMEITSRRVPLGDRIEEVSRPTLLTVGVDEERFLPLLEEAKRIPDLEVVELPASHAVNAHDPDGWNAAVVDFFNQCRRQLR